MLNLVKMVFFILMNIDEVQPIGFPNSFEKCHLIRTNRQNEIICLYEPI